MKKILIVEDEKDFREALKDTLSDHYHVTEAPNGKVAKDLIALDHFDLILSDIQMPYLTGIELLEWVKLHKPTPVVLMTGFSQILETQSAFELGAKDFITKPFLFSDLQQKLNALLETEKITLEKPSRPIETDKDFCHVPIQDFISAKTTEFNLYIRLAKDKYVKVSHQGGKFDGAQIANYIKKNIIYLYIKQDDFRKLVGFTTQVAKVVGASSHVDRDKKLRFMSYTAEMITQNTFVSGVNLDALQNAKGFLETSLDVLTENSHIFELLEMLKDQSNFLYSHSLGVSLFSVMIGKQLGWASQQTLFKLALGGLLHDIGKKEIPLEILQRHCTQLNPGDRKILETHVTRGKEMLDTIKGIPSEVVRITFEHHEDLLGHGYPRRITKSQIHPLTLVVAVANIFCEYTMDTSEGNQLNAVEAIAQMENFRKDGIDPMAFNALKSVIKASVENL